ncbi:hypothetical protein FEZ41_10350 [Lentilactobacillus parafarraginis]|jgi:hypothetical protein|uniref:DUF5626 domain-containing protein n=3 Tax=Lentilactobacillus parafarraginis TaxID=390842 RepID=A0A0R1YHZ2_9LACO|nr:hypothetical protein [Lentilactobacillus parafarraginis]EHL99128.1 hypothetical protein HMPREF9103_01133 [Lentilactobacillus parafarraginis F0439]KRM41869.1 hypothetical protein FD47_GL002062 [Lentilactobacillus parafarraginis DSM 18390 = JCM 14109]TLQ17983.1 hypothetical protein FEZ41_10350 [Lentilactobacillus parafarraginis]
MKKLRLIMLALLVVLGIEMTTNLTQVDASSTTTTPKSLRGTWYKYSHSGKFSTIKITTHSVTNNGTVYSPSRSGSHKLKVSKWGSWYSFNTGSSSSNLGQFKTEKRLINGSYKKALIRYHGIGTYYVFTQHKYHHDYSFRILD